MNIPMRFILIAAALLLARGAAYWMTPTTPYSYVGEDIDLENVFPESFGEWKIDPAIKTIQPKEEESLANQVYNQTVSRGYRNANGDLIMFVAAYGTKQNDSLQLHRPEVCYVANGFKILSNNIVESDIAGAKIAMRQLMTSTGYRHEPVTYWTRVGGVVPSSTLDRQYVKLRYGLQGKIPDGMLVRISNLSLDTEMSYALHRQFLRDMLAHMKAEDIGILLGSVSDDIKKQELDLGLMNNDAT